MNENLNPSTDPVRAEPIDASQPRERHVNADPITGEPGAHPIATGVGAASAGLAGAAIGAVGGPIGSAIGAVIGAIAGGVGGHAAGEAIDPSVEDEHWRSAHSKQPYASSEDTYEDFAPAYRAGYEGYCDRNPNVSTFDQAEPDITRRFSSNEPKIGWDKAKEAARSAWNRVHESSTRNNP